MINAEMNQKTGLGFGPHLTLDLYNCNKKSMADTKLIHRILDELPDLIGMTKISKPVIHPYPGSVGSFDKGGVSAFVLIAESHITIHTFIEQKHVFVDIFSCKEFDVETAENFLKEKFTPEKVDKKLFDRGVEFPRDIVVVTNIVKKERESIKK